MSYDCFISYASADLEFATELHNRLDEAGFQVWFDKDRLQPGHAWHEKIEAGCESSRVLLPVLTPRWKSSDWTRYETYGAEAIIPLIVEGRFEEIVTPPLRRFQAQSVNFTGADASDWERLFTAIRQVLARPVPAPEERSRRTAHLRSRPTAHFFGR